LAAQGELLKMQDETAEAESCYQKPIEIARQQTAKSLELRGCMSLACLWQKQGKRKEAQQVLSDLRLVHRGLWHGGHQGSRIIAQGTLLKNYIALDLV
jgi:hypothetical protein